MVDIYIVLADLYAIVRAKTGSPKRQAQEAVNRIQDLDRTLAFALGRRGAGLQFKPMIDAVKQLDDFDGSNIANVKKAIKALEGFLRPLERQFWDA